MSLLPLLLLSSLALLTLQGAAPPAAASMTSSVWHSAQVSKNVLAAANTSESYQLLEEILCAIVATQTSWCHLFTYENNTCVLYNVVVDSLAAPPPEDTATPCKIRHRNGKTPTAAALPLVSLAATLLSTYMYTVCCSHSASRSPHGSLP